MKTLAIFAVAALLATGCQTKSAPKTLEVEKTEVETTPVTFNVEGAPTAKFHVPDMMCQFACPPAVKNVLTAQTGVKDVKIDFESRTVIVSIDETKFDAEAAVAALVDYQFSNTKLIAAQ